MSHAAYKERGRLVAFNVLSSNKLDMDGVPFGTSPSCLPPTEASRGNPVRPEDPSIPPLTIHYRSERRHRAVDFELGAQRSRPGSICSAGCIARRRNATSNAGTTTDSCHACARVQ